MKYNSIGEQLIAKAKELDPNYKPDKFNDMSEAIDILLNNTNNGDNYIDLVFSYQWFMDHINGYNLTIPANTITEDMLLQIAYGKKKGLLLKIQGPENEEISDLIFLTIALELDMMNEQLATSTTNLMGQVGYWTLPLEDLSQDQVCKFNLIEKKIWYDLDSMSGTITQNQYDEIKALVDTNSLAGIAFKTLSTYCPLANIFDGGIFVFRGIALGLESTGSDRKNAIDESTITIKPDLSITFSLEEIFFPVLIQGLSNQSIISVKTDGYQENLSIGDGLVIKNGELKTKELEMVVSITATLDDLQNAVNSFSNIVYNESDNAEINSFIKNQKGIMKLTIATPVGNLYMTLRPTLWKDDDAHSYNFEGSLYIETDLSAIGGSTFNQIIVRAVTWDSGAVSFRPTIIPIRK